MDDVQITNILKSLPETACFFNGVFSSNQIPYSFYETKNGFIIVNTIKDSSETMGHWLLITMRNGVLEFSDPLSKNPKEYPKEIADFFSYYPGEKTIVFNSPVQAEDSLACGAYAIFISYMSSLGHSVFNIKKNFTSDRKKNDRFVTNFVFKITGTVKSCNKKFCSSYMFGLDCRSFCAC